jgi:hypothetical protein
MVEVFVSTTPPGASISRDGKPLGFAPGPITLPSDVGNVTLAVTATGYQPGTVDLVPATGKRVSVTLKKAMPPKQTGRGGVVGRF